MNELIGQLEDHVRLVDAETASTLDAVDGDVTESPPHGGVSGTRGLQATEDLPSVDVEENSTINESVNVNGAAAPKRYAQIFMKFLNFLDHGCTLDDVLHKRVADSILLSITPEDICRYFNMRAFGKEFPGPLDYPTKCRSSTLNVYKKAISFFSPRCGMQWDNIHRLGNPTRSAQVNKVIKLVKKYEVRQQGVQSQARRPIEYNEFTKMLDEMRANTEKETTAVEKRKYWSTKCLFSLQWHMISRLDDMCHLCFENITNNPSFSFALCLRMRWSKNISEERESPQ